MIKIPGYKIDKEVGQGGMATVYLGIQEFVNREVAIKVMSPSLSSDPTFSERFLKEANCANLSHNNIITVYDAGCIDNHNYIVMEYVSGGDLSNAIKEGLSLERAIYTIKQIAEALGYSNKQGYIHRDVKPDNILFRDDGTAVLADFGIAKATSSTTQLTGVGKAIGSPHYMSPEQTRGIELDGRSDIYSLGIVFYEMLTTKKPYDATDVYAIGMMHISEAIPVLPDKFSKYQPVLDKMLAKDRDDRYTDAKSFITDLDNVHTVETAGSTVAMDAIGKTTVVDMSKMNDSDSNKHEKEKSGSNKTIIGVAASLIVVASIAGLMLFDDKSSQTEKQIVKKSQQIPSSKPDSDFPSDTQRELKPKIEKIIQKPIIKKPQSFAKATPKPELKPDKTIALLKKAQKYQSTGQLVKPDNANAFDTYQKILQIKPANKEAKSGLNKIAEILIHRTKKSINAERLDLASLYIKKSEIVLPDSSRLKKLKAELVEARTLLASFADKQFSDKLPDGSHGPKMIKVPQGSYRMGDIQQSNHDGGERPVHAVNISEFSVSRYEVSFAQYDKFSNATGHPKANDNGWGRGNQPVINISWEDAKAYTQWLSKETAGRYRLITESEWEYIARAGSDKKFTWGSRPGRNKANCKGCGSKWDRKKTAPVGSFKANKFGIYDLHGNVWEWTEDCWSETYQGAPNDGSANLTGSCNHRVLRGGSWNNYPSFMRSANRDQYEISEKTNMFGFRVVRDI